MLKKNIKISGDRGYVMHQCIPFGTALDFISNLAVWVKSEITWPLPFVRDTRSSLGVGSTLGRGLTYNYDGL